MIVIAAQQYYVEYGTALNTERLASLIPSYIPDYMIGGKGSRRDPYSWAREVEKAFRKAYFSKQKVDPQQVRLNFTSLSLLVLFNLFMGGVHLIQTSRNHQTVFELWKDRFNSTVYISHELISS